MTVKIAQIFKSNPEYKSCHSVALCKLANGDLLAAWFAGDEEGSNNSVILISRKEEGKDNWSSAGIAVNVTNRAAGNPRLFVGPDNSVWLIAPINYGEWCQGGTRLFLKRSFDYGKSWSDLELFIEPKGILGKNKPICTKSGTWIIPCEYERDWQAVFIRSTDRGETWEIIECPGSNARLHQPTIIQRENSELLAFMRTWEGVIYQTRSSDDGATWSYPEATGIPNNNSGIDMVKLTSGRIALICNPCSLGRDGNVIVKPEERPAEINVRDLCQADSLQILTILDVNNSNVPSIPGFPTWGPRSPLSILLSDDDGKTWHLSADIENVPGEFSYPAVIQGSEKRIYIAYTANRTEIRFAHYDLPDKFDGKLFYT
ncbi:MAG: hypothetical protein C4545_07515 [Anaerolineaceae bacterium]|jgi:predicted neuraminidase|nr:MAG: hypothetical protein C4545_07515 [Anaerolineaceae bacterium]